MGLLRHRVDVVEAAEIVLQVRAVVAHQHVFRQAVDYMQKKNEKRGRDGGVKRCGESVAQRAGG